IAGVRSSACAATSLRRNPAYPLALNTWAAASKIRRLVWADLDSATSADRGIAAGASSVGLAMTDSSQRADPADPHRQDFLSGIRCCRRSADAGQSNVTGADSTSFYPTLSKLATIRRQVEFAPCQCLRGPRIPPQRPRRRLR